MTVRPLAVPAPATCLGRVAWVDGHDNDTHHGRFVGNLGAKIGVTPTAVRSSLRPIQPYPASQVRQVFDRHSSPRLGRALDYRLANDVVHVSLETVLSLAPLATQFAGATRALLLDLAAHMRVAGTQSQYLCAAVLRAVAIGRESDDAEVDTKHIVRCGHGHVEEMGAHFQSPAPLFIAHEVGLGQFRGISEHLPLMPTDAQLDLDATAQRRDARSIVDDAVQARRIEDDRPRGPKSVPLGLVGFVAISHDSDSADDVLGHEAVVSAHGGVGQALEPDLVKLLSIPRHTADIVARRIKLHAQPLKGGALVGGRAQRQGDGTGAHSPMYTTFTLRFITEYAPLSWYLRKAYPIPPTPKGRGLPGRFQ